MKYKYVSIKEETYYKVSIPSRDIDLRHDSLKDLIDHSKRLDEADVPHDLFEVQITKIS